jgi:hypothetical protein
MGMTTPFGTQFNETTSESEVVRVLRAMIEIASVEGDE